MAIYCDDDDRCRFLTILGTVVERYGLECHAYCQMSNHKRTRDLRIREARDRFHYRVSEIAKHVSLHYATVSRITVRSRSAETCPLEELDSDRVRKSPGHSPVDLREASDRT
jgi:hypothetical protein